MDKWERELWTVVTVSKAKPGAEVFLLDSETFLVRTM
jgi:hypothetical protein